MTSQITNRPSSLDIPEEDLARCHEALGPTSWRALAGQRILVTGGTGFVGKWLLATLLDADEAFGLDCRVTVLSRNPAAFLRDWPEMSARVEWVRGDVRALAPGAGYFDVVVHAATDVVRHASPEDIFTTCLDGTRQVLRFARVTGATRLLLVSSGAVYGQLPPGMTHVPESYLGGPDPLAAASAYGEGKRAAEWLATNAKNVTSAYIARVFSLVGPHLPLDKQFAIGNFLRAALADEEIVIQGDGSTHRSYLYAADMASWLWAILLRGQPGRAYNVGSEESLSIADLARRVCRVLGREPRLRLLQIAPAGILASHYVPDVSRARSELSLPPPISLDDAITRTARWHTSRAANAARATYSR
jgi:nucleoside-diphosphate-sugar epimerase